MKNSEIKKPLVQSGAVLLSVFLLIGFVAGSNAQSFFGGIASIFKGVFFSILFAVALALGLVVSVAVLIAIFLGAVFLYSPETSKNIFTNLKSKLAELYCELRSCNTKETISESGFSDEADISPEVSLDPRPVESAAIPSSELNTLKSEITTDIATQSKQIQELSDAHSAAVDSINSLRNSFADLPLSELSEKTTTLESDQVSLSDNLSEVKEKLSAVENMLTNHQELLQKNGESLSAAEKKLGDVETKLSEIQLQADSKSEPTEQAEPISDKEGDEFRIFTYFEKEEDKQQVKDTVQKAISDDLTYSEIDEYLSTHLPTEIDEVLKGHPSLTKDYIRECRKK